MDLSEQLQATLANLFPEVLGVKFLAATKDLIRAEVFVRPELCTMPGVMHGGAIMAFADTLGAYGTVLNLPSGAGTTTLESKTNFFSKAPDEAAVTGECTPLHRGQRTMVWQTRVTRADGRLVAIVTQTQIVLPARLTPEEQLASLFAEGDTTAHQALLAKLERAGGNLYRSWAEAESDPTSRAALLEAAAREDANAEILEALAKPPAA
jgi:1,4-dihydroxy-2-naphthoyl-CoA hydrolase